MAQSSQRKEPPQIPGRFKLIDNPHKSIRGRLGAEKYQRLMANGEFVAIVKQLDQVSSTILKEFGTDDFEFFGRTYSAINPKDQRKRNKRQLLAWAYQCMERAALEAFVEAVPETYEVKLLVHDCVYLDREMMSKHLVDAKCRLRMLFPRLDFEGEQITPIHASDWVDQEAVRCQTLIAQHHARMKEEDIAATRFWEAQEASGSQNTYLM